ncbi:SUMO-activating enzyme subunit 1 [Podochytrium sp. JEL0797]|nr:SUMO-activating enzyme subunit 1 [Podochytrium sp. JEL0797]
MATTRAGSKRPTRRTSDASIKAAPPVVQAKKRTPVVQTKKQTPVVQTKKRAAPKQNKEQNKRIKRDNNDEVLPNNASAMDEDEMALYDRQIRLWGLEAQTRMRTSRILIAGVTGIANEICKNLVLAGVGNVSLLDHTIVDEHHLGAQFLLAKEDIGKNIAESAAPRIRNLNPRVHLETIAKNLDDMSNNFFAAFDLVIVCAKVSVSTLTRINTICRDQNIKFISTAVFGMSGYMFADLLDYEYVDLATAMTTRFGGMKPKLLKRVAPIYFGLQLLWEFEAKRDRLPAPDSKSDAQILLGMRTEYIASTGGDSAVMNALLTPQVVSGLAQQAQLELMPVCAIVGGIASQDVLNILAGKEVDVCNFFCFGESVGGVVKALGKVEGNGGVSAGVADVSVGEVVEL